MPLVRLYDRYAFRGKFRNGVRYVRLSERLYGEGPIPDFSYSTQNNQEDMKAITGGCVQRGFRRPTHSRLDARVDSTTPVYSSITAISWLIRKRGSEGLHLMHCNT